MSVAEPRGSAAESIVASIKSRPPSGIMFAVFRAVKQFLTLLTLFSLEFYSWSKSPENKANKLHSKGSAVTEKSLRSRRKVSLFEKLSAVGYRLSAADGKDQTIR